MKKYIIPSAIIFFAFILFYFRIGDVPPGINGDEAGIGHNALLISKNLTDENDNFLPLFIFAKGSDWKQPVTVYSTALVFKIFGASLETLRMTSVLFVIASIVIFFLFAKEIYDTKFFIIGSIVLITTPIILIQSHLALENIAVLPFIFFWLLMLAKNRNASCLFYLFLAGASLGIGLFSYLGMRIIVPILTIITLIYFRKKMRQGMYFLLGVFPFFVLLFISNFFYPGGVLGHYSAPIPSINDFLLRYLSVFDLSFLFLKGDITPYHSTGKAGMFLVATLPLFLMGTWKIIKDKKPFEILLLTSFFLTPLMFGFVPDVYRASRLLAFIPFYIIITTIGCLSLSKKWILVMIILVGVSYWNFAYDYWFKYPIRVEKDFSLTANYYNNDFTKK